MSRRDDEISEAFLQGVVGFAGKLTALAGNPLINIQLPPHLSLGWTVTLLSMRNADAARPDGLVAGVPLDNQIATALFPGANGGAVPPERSAYGIEGVYLAVSWGAGFARERAFVSYPYGGGSFQLHGASVRVEAPGGLQSAGTGVSGEGIPEVGAFIAQSHRAQSLIQPTLLTSLRDVGIVDGFFYAPPRAVGYRLWTVNDLDDVVTFGASDVITVRQLVWLAGAPTDFAVDGTNVTAYRGNSNELDVSGGNAWQRATRDASDWTRLLPRTIGLRVSAANPSVADAGIGVEWILDLG